MAGSHRAKPKKDSPKLSKRAWVVTAVIALLPALWLGSQRLLDSPSNPKTANTAPIPPVTSTRTPSSIPTTATPTPTQKPVVAALPRVPASPPRRLRAPGLDVGFDESSEPSAGGFGTRSTAEATRWGSRGTPASPGTDTVFLIGKAYTQSSSAFSGLESLAAGDKITLQTQSGAELTYTVERTESRPESGILNTPDIANKQAGRLVLLGILYDNQDDQRSGSYLVVVAQLSAAKPG